MEVQYIVLLAEPSYLNVTKSAPTYADTLLDHAIVWIALNIDHCSLSFFLCTLEEPKEVVGDLILPPFPIFFSSAVQFFHHLVSSHHLIHNYVSSQASSAAQPLPKLPKPQRKHGIAAYDKKS